MDTKIYCEGAKCAKITINLLGQSPIILLSKNPPVKFTGNFLKSRYITNSKIDILEAEFPLPIISARLLGELSSGAGYCPRDASDGLTFSGNKLEAKNLTPARSFGVGQCVYAVYFSADGKLLVQFFDRLGELYSVFSDEDSFNYSVECDKCCAEDEYLLDSSIYPGWKCVPTPPIANRLGEMQNQVKNL